MATKTDPALKPDHIRSLRDLAANFVRAIDRTALEFEGAATAELTERVACLVALHEMDRAELATMTTKDLRSRVVAIQQVRKLHGDYNVGYELRNMTNGELKKRIVYLRQFNEVKDADDISSLNDEAVDALHVQTGEIIRARKAKAKAEAKAKAKVAAFPAAPRYPVAVENEEEDADVTNFIEETDAA
jgi:hypothetical protein